MRPVVTFTANDRPDCMRATLASWSKVRGIRHALMLFRCEPGCPEMLEVCATAREFASAARITVNDQRYGELSNPWHAIEDGLGFSDYVIYAEDDDLVSSDALEFFAWSGEQYRNSQHVLTVNAFRQEPAGGLDEVALTRTYTSWVWAVWADRWFGKLRDDWDHDYSHRGWDWRIIDHWIGEAGYSVAQPCQSRSQHFGRFGAHFRLGDLERLESHCFDEQVSPQRYREVGS